MVNNVDKKELCNIVRRVLSVLNSRKISALDDLKRYAGKEVLFEDSPGDSIKFMSKPRKDDAYVLLMEYNRKDYGAVILTMSNPALDFSQISVKAGFLIQGYSEFANDKKGNYSQSLRIKSSKFSEVRAGLEALLRV